ARAYGDAFLFTGDDLLGGFSANPCNFPLQAPYSRLPRVKPDNIKNRFVIESDLRLRQAVLFQLFWNQMIQRNRLLFNFRVSGNGNDLHPITQWTWNSAQIIGSRNEKHIG